MKFDEEHSDLYDLEFGASKKKGGIKTIMADEKRVLYYWIKLKDDFMTGDAVDFLMGQTNGANYVVLYQILCLKTANTMGRFESKIGEVIIQWDTAKIQRECKYFTQDTVIIALELYKKLGLVYTQKDNCLCISNHEKFVGKHTKGADLKQKQRSKSVEKVDSGVDDVVDDTVDSEVDKRVDNVHQECKSLELKSLESESERNSHECDDTHTQNLCKLISNILPTVVINCEPTLTEDEYRKIADEFAKSEFCKQTFGTLLKVQKCHKQILAGDFRDFKKKQQQNAMAIQNSVPSKTMSGQELNALFDDKDPDEIF